MSSAEPDRGPDPAPAAEAVDPTFAAETKIPAETSTVAPAPRGSDPERGFRGVMSGALILQAVTILLGLPVASSGRELPGWELAVILGLALACVVACAFVKKKWIVPLVVGLQVVAIGCWVIHPALGVMGLIFAAVWGVLFYFRAELRRRAAEGLLPAQQAAGRGPTPTSG